MLVETTMGGRSNVSTGWNRWNDLVRRGLGACLAFLLAAAALGAESPEPSGDREPIPLPIVAPGYLLVYQPSPTGTDSLEPGRLRARFELSESNVLHPADDPPGLFATEVDLELTRFQMAFDLGLTERWDLGVEIPFYYVHSGFLDHAIREVESGFGKLKPRRRDEIQGEFAYTAFVDDRLLIRGVEDNLGLGDVAFTAQRRLRRASDDLPGVAVRAAVKLPSGDDEVGFSSGGVDLALGTVLEWQPAAWSVTAGLSVTVPLEQPRRLAGLHAMPVVSGWAEAAYPLTRRLAAHAQLAWATQPFDEETGITGPRREGENRTFTGHVLQITPALSWRFESGRTLYVGLVEDFLKSGNTASDVTAFFALRMPLNVALF